MATSWVGNKLKQWKRDVSFVLWQARTLALLLKHPRTPWTARLVAGCAAGYLLSPVQLIPNFIPIIGQMDDLLVLLVGMKWVRKLAPPQLIAECEAGARQPFRRKQAARRPAEEQEIQVTQRPVDQAA